MSSIALKEKGSTSTSTTTKGARDEHLPVKSGNVNWRRVAKGLEGYEGRFVTEARTLVQGAQSMRNLKAFLEGSA